MNDELMPVTNDQLRDGIKQESMSEREMYALLETTRAPVQQALGLTHHQWHDLEMYFQLRQQLYQRETQGH